MFEKLKFNMDRVYPTLVVSTMSSGKSTLINALVGKELLPSHNTACTAKAVVILDNDMKQEFEVHAVTKDGQYKLIKDASKKVVTAFNDTNDVSEMILEGQIRGIKNSKKSLLLVDTPGINNSMDSAHENVTKSVLNEYKEGLILYIINAAQMATYDDDIFLTLIEKKMKESKNFNIIFVINKMDYIDTEIEDPDELVHNCKKYIESKGIKDPVIVPVSSEGALIFKKVLYGEKLSEIEEEDFRGYYRRFRNDSYSLADYISTPETGDMKEIFEVDGIQYSKAKIYGALYNTGFLQLEKIIEETLVYSLKMRAPEISFVRPSLALRRNEMLREQELSSLKLLDFVKTMPQNK